MTGEAELTSRVVCVQPKWYGYGGIQIQKWQTSHMDGNPIQPEDQQQCPTYYAALLMKWLDPKRFGIDST